MSSGLHHELSSGLWSHDMNSSAQLDVWCVAEQELNSYLICCFYIVLYHTSSTTTIVLLLLFMLGEYLRCSVIASLTFSVAP